MNVLNLYREIGIDFTLSDKFFHKDLFLFKENKQNSRSKQNQNTQEIKDKKIIELEYSFKNFEGCKLKKTSTNAQQQGNAYKLYGCGYFMPKGTALNDIDDPEILIPLETLVILSG